MSFQKRAAGHVGGIDGAENSDDGPVVRYKNRIFLGGAHNFSGSGVQLANRHCSHGDSLCHM